MRLIKVLFIAVELVLFIDNACRISINMYGYICTRTFCTRTNVPVHLHVFLNTCLFPSLKLIRTIHPWITQLQTVYFIKGPLQPSNSLCRRLPLNRLFGPFILMSVVENLHALITTTTVSVNTKL